LSKEFEDRAGTAHLAVCIFLFFFFSPIFLFLTPPPVFVCFFLQALEALSGECSSRVKGITQTLSANEAHAALKRQVEKDAKAMAAFFNVENASDDIEQTSEVQLLTEKGFIELVCSFPLAFIPLGSFNEP